MLLTGRGRGRREDITIQSVSDLEARAFKKSGYMACHTDTVFIMYHYVFMDHLSGVACVGFGKASKVA